VNHVSSGCPATIIHKKSSSSARCLNYHVFEESQEQDDTFFKGKENALLEDQGSWDMKKIMSRFYAAIQ